MSSLFENTNIKTMELKNRLVRSATHEGMSDENGFPTPALYKLYERLAKGGIGLITTGFAFVDRDGKSPFIGMHGIDSDEDIERIFEAFAQASRRVRESGFDAVQIHGAHGFLVNQFLCPHTNRRKDKWGGTIENRMRFVEVLYDRCRRQVGDDFPILIKINAYDNMKKGLILEESVVMAKTMAEMGFDGIEVSCGNGADSKERRRQLHLPEPCHYYGSKIPRKNSARKPEARRMYPLQLLCGLFSLRALTMLPWQEDSKKHSNIRFFLNNKQCKGK